MVKSFQFVEKMKNKKLVLIGIGILLFISILLGSTMGAFKMEFKQIIDTLLNPYKFPINYKVLLDIRFPRIILEILIGVAFGISGAMMQTLFRNPLADPALIGVAAGASGGVVTFIMLGSFLPTIFISGLLSYFTLPISAFLGAVATTIAIYKLATFYKRVLISIMLLAGIAINALVGSLIGLFSYVSTDEQLRSFTFWTMGSLANADKINIAILTPIIILTTIFSISKTEELNLLLLGEDEARQAGVSTEIFKKQIIICVSLAVGVGVAFCGIIGFIGLIIPHISRFIVGSNHKYMIPLSALMGAFVLIWADAFSRTIIAPAELPIGIVTSILGAPFFIYLLLKNRQDTLT